MKFIGYGIAFLLGAFLSAILVALFFIDNQISISINSSISLDIIAQVSSTLIAACALLLTFRQIKSSEKSDKISVTPKMTSSFSRQTKNRTLSMSLKNSGIGPAKFTSYKFLINGENVESNDHLETLLTPLFIHDEDLLLQIKHGFVKLSSDMLWSTKEEMEIFNLEFIPQPGNEVDLVAYEQILKQAIVINIEYESLYGEKVKENITFS